MDPILEKIKRKKIIYKSKYEKNMMELLGSIHSPPISRWKRLKENERRILRDIAANKNHPLRKVAIFGLVSSNDKNHVQQLEKIIKNKKENKLSRLVSIISLGMSNDPNAETVLMQFIEDEDYFTRAKVIESLGKVGGKICLPLLIMASKDSLPLVSGNAIKARKMISFRLREEDVKK